MQRKKLNIGLFGFGCVGYGLYQTLHQTRSLNADIKKICVRDRAKPRPIAANAFTFDREELLGDESLNVIVELIDDAEAAFEIVSEALRRGKAVVSANKKMIAEHLPELLELQRRYKAPLLYEAACCASIPVIRNLEEYFDNDLLYGIEGIINGSTNYILSKVADEGLTYHEALRQAQALGFAESDPSLDTEGHDAAYKLQILLAHAFGVLVRPEKIFRLGISRLSAPALQYAREKGYKVKLVARARRANDGSVSAYVLPCFVGKEDKLYHVDDVFNGLKITSCFADQQFFSGKGAGAFPTASAVISDISALSYDYRYEYKKLSSGLQSIEEDLVSLRVLIAQGDAHVRQWQDFFSEVEETHVGVHDSYLCGTIDLKCLKELTTYGKEVCVVRLPVNLPKAGTVATRERELAN